MPRRVNLAYVKYFAKATDAVSATFKSIDSTGFVVSYKKANGVEKDARIEFQTPLTKREEIRPVLEAMAKEAEDALGLPSSLSGPPPIAAIAKAMYANAMHSPPSGLWDEENLDVFQLVSFRKAFPIVAICGATLYLQFATAPPVWAAQLRDIFPTNALRYSSYFILIAHSLESTAALALCLKRGVYSWRNTFLWTVQGLVTGFPSTMAIIDHGKVVKEARAKKQQQANGMISSVLSNAFSPVDLVHLPFANPTYEQDQVPTASTYKPPYVAMNSSPLATTTPSAKVARQPFAQVAADFNTDVNVGLTNNDATYRRKIHGYNEFETAEKESLLLKFWKSFVENPLILLLLGSAVVSLIMGQMDDAFSITLVSRVGRLSVGSAFCERDEAIVIVVTVYLGYAYEREAISVQFIDASKLNWTIPRFCTSPVAFVQEYRSEKSLEALNKLVPHNCKLIREGQTRTILASELVPGDLVRFSIGDRIPADIRLVTHLPIPLLRICQAVDLEVDESNLTGENKPRRKQTEAITDNPYTELEVSRRDNIAFMGTLVEDRKTPLQISMDELGKQLSYLSFGIIGVIVLIGIIQGRKWLEMFTIGVSLAVAAIPEGLPIVVTVTLALGVLRMANRRAIVKKLPSVETLGSVSVICADKTGTLTVNQMTVTKVFTLSEQTTFDFEHTVPNVKSMALRQLLKIGNLCNNAYLDDHGKFIGQPTDIALLDVMTRSGLPDDRTVYDRVSEMPFNSDQKYMSVICRHKSETANDGRDVIYFKGAVEPVLERCTTYYISDNEMPVLDSALKDVVGRHVAAMSAHGLRVLAMAFGSDAASLCFVGFVAMYDPPRLGVSESIRALVQGGVKVVMITGDSDGTAMSIARRLGIPLNVGRSGCLTGRDIETMTERQLQEVIGGISVFARTTPKHKMAIIRAFQAKGHIVAMTGDGVNDAPALKMADIGISMGKSGTDVSKEAADMILVDDDLSTILSAIEEGVANPLHYDWESDVGTSLGKSIFYNIQNFLTFQLSTSISALTLIALSTIFGFDNPLNAMQILWIITHSPALHLFTTDILMDGPPAQSLGVEPVDHDVMRKPPRPKNKPILTRVLIMRVLSAAAIVVVGTMFIYVSEMQDGVVTARDTTM
ncbi:hypothetical protein BC936DRAFT_139007, partial [Jimgerdemannia flammicorona]